MCVKTAIMPINAWFKKINRAINAIKEINRLPALLKLKQNNKQIKQRMTYFFVGKLCRVDDMDGLIKHLIGPTFVVKSLRVHLSFAWTISVQHHNFNHAVTTSYINNLPTSAQLYRLLTNNNVRPPSSINSSQTTTQCKIIAVRHITPRPTAGCCHLANLLE